MTCGHILVCCMTVSILTIKPLNGSKSMGYDESYMSARVRRNINNHSQKRPVDS